MITRSLQSGLLVLALGLAACSSGGGSDTTSARGAVVKGPVQEAQVQLFALDEAGFAIGDAIQTLTTDATGRFTFSRPANGPALLAVTRGGSFVDESDPQTDPLRKRRITLTDQEGFESVLPAGATTLVVTPYTESLLLRARRAANGANFLIFFDAVRARAIEAFGFDPFAVIPEPPLTPDPAAPLEARRYALLLGGAALAIQTQASSLGTVPTYATIRAFIVDFSDGRLDGQLNGDPVSVSDTEQVLPTNVSLADAVLRFRNNNFAAYAELDASSIDETQLSAALDLANQPPIARDDLFSTGEDVELVVAAPGVLGNDIDSETTSITAQLLSNPDHGDLVLASDGSFTYTPDSNFSGTDSFTYRVSDGDLLSSAATVSLTVGALNDSPAAVADSYSLNEDTTLTVSSPGILDNDSDPENSPISAVLIAGPARGVLSLNPNGSFTYTPGANFNGSDTFTYQVSDGTAQSVPATVSLTVNPVNDFPSALDDSFSTDEDVPLEVPAPGILGDDSDTEGSALTAVLIAGPTTGTLNLNSDGGFTYVPKANFSGVASFTYRAFDGSAQSKVAKVSLTINPVNDSPSAQDNGFSTNEDTPLNVSAPGVLNNDSDVEGAALTAVLLSGPSSGALTLRPNGSFLYTPAKDFSGSTSFTYAASDDNSESDPATVTLTVNPVNDAPSATNNSFSTDEDTVLTVASPGVLGDDSDPEGSVLTAVLVSRPPNGLLNFNPNGSFTFTPNANFNGTTSFTYRAFDGTAQSAPATVSLTVTPVNDPPSALDNSYATDEDKVLNVSAPGVLGNDSDSDNASISAELVAGPANGIVNLNPNGSFTYTPNANFNGGDSFTYQVSDGSARSGLATVSLTVRAVNDIPLALDNSFSTDEDTTLVVAAPGILGDDSDPEGSALTTILVSGPPSGALSLNENGGFTFTPNTNFSGLTSFTYRAFDGAAQSGPAKVTLTVKPIPDPPRARADNYSTAFNTPLNRSAPGVLQNDDDVDSPQLVAILNNGPSEGTLNLRSDGSFTFMPRIDFIGNTSFTYRASDGELTSAPVTVTISVQEREVPPEAVADNYSASQGDILFVRAPGLLANDKGRSLTAQLFELGNTGEGGGVIGSLLFEDTFDNEPAPQAPATSLIRWSIEDGAVDLQPPSQYQLSGGGLLLDLAGTPSNSAGIIRSKTNFSLPPGDYVLTFLLGNSEGNGFESTLTDGDTSAESPQVSPSEIVVIEDGGGEQLPPIGSTMSSTMTVSVAGASQAFASSEDTQSGQLQLIRMPFTVTDSISTPIIFDHADGGGGLVIDDVRLIRLNVLPSDGSFVYIADSCTQEEADPAFSYRVTNGSLLSAPAPVTITVGGCDF